VEPGRILADRYEILHPIGGGASSTVWEARDTETGSEVAVKAVSMELAGWRSEVRDRFEKEGRLLQLVDSPHIVGVRDRGETDDGYLYLVLDRLRGETLAERIEREPRLSWREAASIGEALAAGLGALHARGIVHRDLKPANVILDARSGDPPVCKIIDLGISRASAAAADPVLFATLTATGQLLGTPEYMSYEQAIGERHVDARTDVWSLGAMLYEMLSGERPFEGSHPNAVLAAIRRGPPAPLRGVPEPLAAVVMSCFARERDRRPADGEALRAALASAVLRPAGEPAPTSGKRAMWIALGGAVAIAAGSAALALGARAPKDATQQIPPPVTSASLVAPSAAPSPVPPATGAPSAPLLAPTALPSASARTEPPPTPPPRRRKASPTRVNDTGF
jgi:eukaryotic-like serine/threonine-protein kinase